LDGQRLNDARQGAPDLSLVPASSIERIEVLKGGASAVYGADALGGVIAITTKRPGDRRLEVGLSNHSWPLASGLLDGQSLRFDGSAPIGGAAVSLSVSGERAGNGYPLDDGTLRSNADFAAGGARLAVSLPLAAGEANAQLGGSWREAGVPGSTTWVTPESRQEDGALRGQASWSSDALLGGLLSLDLRGEASLTRLDYQDPDYPGRYDSARGGAEFRASALFSDTIELGFGASLSIEGTRSSVFETLEGGQPSRLSAGAYLEPRVLLGRLRIVPALRYDWNDDFPAGLSALCGLVYAATDDVELRLSAGSSYRAPSFNELFWPYMSNPDLGPERGFAGELSASVKNGPLSAEVSAFARLVDDMIQNDVTWTPQNLGRVFTPGAEA
ncbi:MAG: TonB-dependent receptor, partial [Spirochaetaceae bacterium]|nr:TonB-dependent receptor [Spirochaetaceae bacterium]